MFSQRNKDGAGYRNQIKILGHFTERKGFKSAFKKLEKRNGSRKHSFVALVPTDTILS